MARKMKTLQEEKQFQKKVPLKKAKKSNPIKKAVPAPMISLGKKREILETLEEIENLIKHNKMITIYSHASADFTSFCYVIAKLTNLEVLYTNNNNIFMPHEKKERKDFCVLYILQVGKEIKEDEKFIDELKKMGCPTQNVLSTWGVREFFSKLD